MHRMRRCAAAWPAHAQTRKTHRPRLFGQNYVMLCYAPLGAAKRITNTRSKNEHKEHKARIRELTDEIARLHSAGADGQASSCAVAGGAGSL